MHPQLSFGMAACSGDLLVGSQAAPAAVLCQARVLPVLGVCSLCCQFAVLGMEPSTYCMLGQGCFNERQPQPYEDTVLTHFPRFLGYRWLRNDSGFVFSKHMLPACFAVFHPWETRSHTAANVHEFAYFSVSSTMENPRRKIQIHLVNESAVSMVQPESSLCLSKAYLSGVNDCPTFSDGLYRQGCLVSVLLHMGLWLKIQIFKLPRIRYTSSPILDNCLYFYLDF